MASWRLTGRAACVAVEVAVLLWPGTGMAVGSDNARGGGAGSVVTQGPHYQVIYHPAEGTSSDPADPDTAEIATRSGWYELQLDGNGSSPPIPEPHTGDCSPSSSGLQSATLDLPAVMVGSNPSGPVNHIGQGGVVGITSNFWVDGPDRLVLGRSSGVLHVHVVNCTVSTPPPPALPHVDSHDEDYTLEASWTASTPEWAWGDGATGVGWGEVNGDAVNHKWSVGSVQCLPSLFCMTVPGKGQSYIVRFTEPVTVRVSITGPGVPDGGTEDRAATRSRVYPVREVQSVLDR